MEEIVLKIKYTRLVLQDLKAGYDYISHENPMGARQVMGRLEEILEHLKGQPFIGHKGRVEGTYEVFVSGTPFIIVYQVKSELLVIVSVLHTARKYP